MSCIKLGYPRLFKMLFGVLLVSFAISAYSNLEYVKNEERVASSLVDGSGFHVSILADDIMALASSYDSDPERTRFLVASAVVNSKALATLSKALNDLEGDEHYRKWYLVYGSLFMYFAGLTGKEHEDIVNKLSEDGEALQKIAAVLERAGSSTNPFEIQREELDNLVDLASALVTSGND